MNKYDKYLGKFQIKFREGVYLLKPSDIVWKYEDILRINTEDPDYAVFRE